MVKIRLTRKGAKKKPFYRIVVADQEAKRDGRFLESIGVYDPKNEPYRLEIDEDRLKHWVSKGAQPTQTLRSLFKKRNIALS